MQVGILALGGRKSIGTVYYVTNLIKALRTLSVADQPCVTLIEDADTDRNEYAEAHVLADRTTGERQSASWRRPVVQVGLRVVPLLSRVPGVLSMARRFQQRLQKGSRRTLAGQLQELEIDVLFPCVWSMGPDYPVPWIPWVWDLQHRSLPKFFPAAEIRSRDQRIGDMLADAPVVVTSSDHARRDLAQHWPGSETKVRVLHFRSVPSPDWFEPDYHETCRRYRLPEKYLILPNHFSDHKNHAVAFEAIRILRDRGVEVPLVCTGNTTNVRNPGYTDSLRRFLRDKDLEARVMILGFISRADQIQLIRGSAAILQPSLFEGWSTLVEDARALAKPIFVSDIPVHREQAPPEGVFFSPTDAEALAHRISEHWDRLENGNRPDREAAIREAHSRIVEAYARTFLGIAAETIAAGPG